MIITRNHPESTLEARRASEPAVPDAHPWRSAVVLGVVTVVGGMLYTLVIGPLVERSGGWWIVPDAWVPLRAASFVANGALGYIYESSPIFVTTPLLPIVLSPLIFVEQHFGLVEGYPRALPHPSMWPVYAPYALALSTVLYYAVRALATQLGIVHGRLGAQIAALLLVVIPAAVVWGHYEDVLAVAFVMLSIRALLRARWLPAALLFGVAVAFKQWALLGVPVLIAACPARERARALGWSLILPGLFVAFPLAVDWTHASAALLHTRSFPQMGHRALWISPSVVVTMGNPTRAGAFVVAGALAWWLRGRTEPRLLLAGFALVFLARLLFEPVVFSYYVCPALGLLALHERLAAGTYRRTFVVGTALLLFFAVHPPEPLWWAAALILGAVVAWPAMKDVLRREVSTLPAVSPAG